MKCTHCGGGGVVISTLPTFEATGLGAPFKVILEHAVKVEACNKCGTKLGTFVPDMEGLFYAVVFARALEPRKLSGDEIRFMRKAMGWKAKDLATRLGVSPEHFSRCENNKKIMDKATEKLFRLYCLLKTPDKSALQELEVSNLFELIEIESMWDASKPLVFHFVRRSIGHEHVPENDEKWRKEAA